MTESALGNQHIKEGHGGLRLTGDQNSGAIWQALDVMPGCAAALINVQAPAARSAAGCRAACGGRRRLVSPGSRPMTFTRRRVSPKVRSMKLECRDPLVMPGREPQVAGQLLASASRQRTAAG